MSRIDKSVKTENELLLGVEGKGELGVTVNQYRVSFWVDGDTVNLYYTEFTENQLIVCLKRVHFMVCKVYLQTILRKPRFVTLTKL